MEAVATATAVSRDLLAGTFGKLEVPGRAAEPELELVADEVPSVLLELVRVAEVLERLAEVRSSGRLPPEWAPGWG